MIDDVRQATSDAITALEAITDLDGLAAFETATLGKKAPLTLMKRQLGQLEPEDRKAAGQALNAARQEVEAAIGGVREALSTTARAAVLEAERLDLTELRDEIRRGSLHLVTQARDRLEDVFVGMGYTIAEGPEVESAWYNFEALNIPEWHPARGSFDTIFVNLGEPEQVMLRSHTSPVQIRTMENTEPPIYIVAPGRTFRTDTADAPHLPAWGTPLLFGPGQISDAHTDHERVGHRELEAGVGRRAIIFVSQDDDDQECLLAQEVGL